MRSRSTKDLTAYKEQDKNVSELKSWILDHVADHWKSTACMPNESLRTWYTTLKEHVGISKELLQERVRDNYRKILSTRGERISNWETWIENRERTLHEAMEAGVPEASHAPSWFKDLLTALSPRHERWTTSYRISNRAQVYEGAISFREVANEFRAYLREITASHPAWLREHL